MSSHHVVRDAQEPALIIWEPELLSLSQAAPLLEWSPRVLVHEAALEEVLSWQVKIDGVIGAPEQGARFKSLLAAQWPLVYIEPELERVFHWLAAHQHREINLVMADDGQRQLIPFLEGFQLQLMGAGWRYHPLKRLFEKWVPEGQQFRLRDNANVSGKCKQVAEGEWVAERSGFIRILPEDNCWVGWPLG